MPYAFDGALAGLAAGFLAAGLAAGLREKRVSSVLYVRRGGDFLALGDLALAAGLALGEAAFFGLFFGAALGLAGDFLATVFFFAGLFAFEGRFLRGALLLGRRLGLRGGLRGRLLGGLGRLGGRLGGLGRPAAGAVGPDAVPTRRVRTPPSRLASRRAWTPWETWPRLGALLGRRLLGRGPVTRS